MYLFQSCPFIFCFDIRNLVRFYINATDSDHDWNSSAYILYLTQAGVSSLASQVACQAPRNLINSCSKRLVFEKTELILQIALEVSWISSTWFSISSFWKQDKPLANENVVGTIIGFYGSWWLFQEVCSFFFSWTKHNSEVVFCILGIAIMQVISWCTKG